MTWKNEANDTATRDVELGAPEAKEHQQSHISRRGIAASLFYGITSISIVFVNKLVLKHTSCIAFLAFGQCLSTVIFTLLARVLGYTKFSMINGELARRYAPLAFFSAGKAFADLLALRLVNVPMFSVLKRLTTPLIMLQEIYFLGKVIPWRVQRAVW
eukprot:CAMPEP_0184644916 /NCGR_PEP_ID=MMETSP0308-20130426/1518_1 /TAXON_ID=38269 /ORGANISM="Gloeochaete witrockiana, Strain SAG 46.84" /LENGTH=157 /DNA_ID=CAMNT_0027073657 /DNA_START=177 /DNA_END=647 /DNA_ORIENTATION=+